MKNVAPRLASLCSLLLSCFLVAQFNATIGCGADARSHVETEEGTLVAEPTGKRALKCALLYPEPSGLVTVLETSLAATADRVWLDRSQLDKIVEEQELQSLLGAAAGPARNKLGRVLKADILVFVRIAKAAVEGRPSKVKYAELVVSETDGGVRLLARRIPLSDDEEADAAALAALVEQAIRGHGESNAEIYAVPPFVSQDLTYDHDHLKGAYAALIEQSLLDREGIVVVELAEAEAMAREFKLAGDEGSLRRRLPYYVLGEYRTERADDGGDVRLRIVVQHGGETVSKFERTLPLDDAPEFLLATGRSLAHCGEAADKPRDPAVEAKQLAARAAEFLRLGNGSEAIPLIETSLLLDRENLDRRYDAILALSRMPRVGRSSDLVTRVDEIRRRRRALEHLEAIVHDGEAIQKHLFTEAVRLVFVPLPPIPVEMPDETLAIVEQIHQLERSVAMAIAHHFARRAAWRESSLYLGHAVTRLEAREQFAERAKMIEEYQDRTVGAPMVAGFALGNYTIERLRSVEGREFLRRLATSDEFNADVRRAAMSMEQQLNAALAGKEPSDLSPAKPIAAPRDGGLKVSFKPISLPRYGFNKWFAGQGFDVVASTVSLGVMKKPGAVQVLWKAETIGVALRDVCFDGRYAWAVVWSPSDAPRLLIVDPAEERIWQMGPEDGLPVVARQSVPKFAGEQVVRVAGIEPGTACVAGGFGRGWIAVATMPADGRPKIDIVHEAREIPEKPDFERDWKNAATAFSPGGIVSLSSSPDATGACERRIVVLRAHSPAGLRLASHPLVVDLVRRSVEADTEYWWDWRDGAVHEGALYTVLPHPTDSNRLSLCKIAPPNLQRTAVISDVKEGVVVFTGDRVHVAGKQWWTGKLSDSKLANAGDVPWVYQTHWGSSGRDPEAYTLRPEHLRLRFIAPSAHYGLVAYYDDARGANATLAQVVLEDCEASNTDRDSPLTKMAPIAELDVAFVEPAAHHANRRVWDSWLGMDCRLACWGDLLVTANPIQLWNLGDGQFRGRLDVNGRVLAIALSHDGKLLAAGLDNGAVLTWSMPDRRLLWSATRHRARVTALRFSPDSRSLASTAMDSRLNLWDVADGTIRHEHATGGEVFKRLDYSPDGRLVTTSGTYGTRFVNAETGRLDHFSETLADLGGFLADGRAVGIASGARRAAITWDPKTHETRTLIPQTVGDVMAFSADGRHLVTQPLWTVRGDKVDHCRRLFVWDLQTGQEIGKGIEGQDACFTPDGQNLVYMSPQRGTQLWQVSRGTQ
jgi:hypothetical protein